MKIGVCGIACEVCGLYTKGICPGCTTHEMNPCEIPRCAERKKVEFCSRDCEEFPCKYYGESGELYYPFSKEFLESFKNRLVGKEE